MLVLYIILQLSSSCIVENSSLKPDLREVKTYVTYYGEGDRLKELALFDMVIIDNDDYTAEEVKYLKTRGVIVLSYQSLGTAENWHWYWGMIKKKWLLAPLKEWEGEWYINACCKGWRSLIIDHILPKIVEKGFDGFLFDNIDVIEEYPEMTECIVELIKDIRDIYPNKIIVLNNPLSIIEEVYMYIDGIMQEDVFLTYNWDKNNYVTIPFNRSNNLVEKLKFWSRKGLKTFILDYTDTEILAKYYYLKAKKYGFVYYACNIMLDKICKW